MRRPALIALVLVMGACFTDPPDAGGSSGSGGSGGSGGPTGSSAASTTKQETTSTDADDSSSSFGTWVDSSGTTFGTTTDFDTSSTGPGVSTTTDMPPLPLCTLAGMEGAVACADFEQESTEEFGWDGELNSEGVMTMPVETGAAVGNWSMHFDLPATVDEVAFAQRSSVGLGDLGLHGSAWVRSPGPGQPVVVLGIQWPRVDGLNQVLVRVDDTTLSAFYTGPSKTLPLGDVALPMAGAWTRFTFSLNPTADEIQIGLAEGEGFTASVVDLSTDGAYRVVYGTYLDPSTLVSDRDFDLDGIVVFADPE